MVSQLLLKVMRIAVLSCVVGLVLVFGLGRVLSAMLYEVSPLDPLTLSIVVVMMLVVAALAALVPATRAATLGGQSTARVVSARGGTLAFTSASRNGRDESTASMCRSRLTKGAWCARTWPSPGRHAARREQLVGRFRGDDPHSRVVRIARAI